MVKKTLGTLFVTKKQNESRDQMGQKTERRKFFT
jgi:chaperonin cofactor prefoldin